MTVSFLAWLALIGAIAVMLVIDLLVVGRRGGEMSLRFASLASVVWVAIALAFGGLLWLIGETGAAADYTAGYLVEKSLSLDNVFVFLLVFGAFGVAQAERHRLLTYGIVGALVMRAVFIVIGAAALERFSLDRVRLRGAADLHGLEHVPPPPRPRLRGGAGRQAAQALPDRGGRRRQRQARRPRERQAALTVGGAALASIAVVDVIFAVDSVPAILAITPVPFIVFAANAFALLGLRPLFFLVAELVERLYYLKTALALLLIAIGAQDGRGRAVRQDRAGVLAARDRADPRHRRRRVAGPPAARGPARRGGVSP